MLSQLLSRILWYKRFLSLFSRFLHVFIYNESFKSCEKHPQSFLVQGVFLDLLNGWYLLQWVLEWVFEVVHAAQMLNSYNRMMTKLGWKCFLSNSKPENYLFFSWEKLETIHHLMIQLWIWNSSTRVLYLPTFFHALYFSVHRQDRNLSSTEVAAELSVNL